MRRVILVLRGKIIIKEKNMQTQNLLKLISILLQYPNKETKSVDWQEELKNISESDLFEYLNKFDLFFRKTPLEKLQETYVHTFDFNEENNLYLSYSKLGDKKERGQVLAELKQIYEFAGFKLNSTELPDYLPLMLEFVSYSDSKIRADLLSRFRNNIEQIQQVLVENKNPYSNLLKGLLIIIDYFILK